jgi:two-component system NtrC family sensor kinase
MNVLIAEDDAVSRRLLRSLLERWHHHVVEAEDGQQAWELYQQSPTSLIVADWMMPNMDGVELIRRVRTLSQSRYTYTMLVTAKTQKADLVAAMEAGADDFISKPFDRDELRVRLQAGQRILALHEQLTSAEKSATVGRVALGLASEIRAPLADAMTMLNELRSQSLALSYALQLYRDAQPALATAAPALVQQLTSETEQLSLSESASGLAHRFTETLEHLQKVNEVVRSLREFASLDRYPSKPLALKPLLVDALRMCNTMASDAGVHVHFDSPDNLGMVLGNAGKLKRLVVNLLTRAISLSPSGSKVEVRATSAEAKAVLTVTDDGPRLSPQYLLHLFDPFHAEPAAANAAADAGTADASRPSGLALSVCETIAREHGGSISATAGLGGRTVVSVCLPLSGGTTA